MKKILEEFFKDDGFVKLSGIELVLVDETQAVARAKISREHLNANGCVQGGMLYTLADFAFAALANYLHPATVTQGGQISYIRAAYTSVVTAKAREITRAGHNCVYEVVIYDDKDEIVSVCTFNGFIKEIPHKDWDWKMREKKHDIR